MSDERNAIRRVARSVRDRFVPDRRTEVFQLRTRRPPQPGGSTPVQVETTLPEAALAFVRRLEEDGIAVDIDLTLLPDPTLEPRGEALVRAAIAPAYREPGPRSVLLTQYPLGARLTLLNRRKGHWRVRGEDGLIGWVHHGYLVRGELDWALGWERAEGGEPVVSLGATLVDEAERIFARLPWGARVIQQAGGRILLPDGRTGSLGEGELVAAGRLWDRFPPRGESVTRTARRWLGVPHLPGGVTPFGVDAPGFLQSVYWIHGVALPREPDMQRRLGEVVEPGEDWAGPRAGDLLFFRTDGRAGHVALSLGGSHLIHACATNGGVDVNDLQGERPLERRLRDGLEEVRRLLPG